MIDSFMILLSKGANREKETFFSVIDSFLIWTSKRQAEQGLKPVQ